MVKVKKSSPTIKIKISRPYRTSNPTNLALAAKSVKGGNTIRKACLKYGVKRSTLSDYILKTHDTHQIGRPQEVSSDIEKLIVRMLDALSSWGAPVGPFEIKLMVKNIFDKQGKNSRFTNNLPGDRWVNAFINRHNLSQRIANNIKKSRASVDSTIINDYFNELEHSLVNIPAGNLFNYDETNFQDNPGAKKVIVSRGTKRVEFVREHSKTSISLMWCGSAAGAILAPMVIYKAKNLYEGWSHGGPEGTIYDVTDSGWFDARTFCVWFKEIFIPYVQANCVGPTVIIGDNLASHFDMDVLTLCEQNNVRFVALPPNATHLTQPLDVSVYAPMKKFWRKVLCDWRAETRLKGCFPKEVFPSLLGRLSNAIAPTIAECLQSGFRTCGLSPINRNEVLKKLPDFVDPNSDLSQEVVIDILNDTMIELLKQNRGADVPKRTRGKKIVAGRCITTSDIRPSSTQTSVDSVTPSTTDTVTVADVTPNTVTPNTVTPNTVTSNTVTPIIQLDPNVTPNVTPEPESAIMIQNSRSTRKRKKCYVQIDDSICHICNMTEPDSPNQILPYGDENIQWVGCSNCPRWYHLLCVEDFDNPCVYC